MDVDGLPPPSISRAPRELLELQKAIDNFSFEDGDFDDEAAPPPIQRPRTTPSRASPSDNVSKSPVAPKRLASSPKQPTPVPRFATPPTWMVAKPYPQYNDLISVPTRAPPPEPDRIPPLRVNTYHSSSTDRHAPPLPSKNPRRSHFEPEPLEPSRPDHARNFSHPLKKQLNLQSQTQPQRQPKYANTASFRHPPRPVSFRNSSRTPYSMRRWSSLDTIDSVQTTQETSRENSIDGTESMRTEISSSSKRQYLSFDDGGQGEDEDSLAGDIPGTPPASSVSLPSTPSDDSRRSSASNSLRSISTTTQGSGSKRSTTASLMRRLKGNKTSEPLLTPESLEVEKRASLDQSSRTNSSNSTMTISSGRPSEAALPGSSHGSTSQLSVSSKEWKSSNFDTSGLTQAELKKCKKKGINPALYAEMKAARKGRFVSPIGGNTFI